MGVDEDLNSLPVSGGFIIFPINGGGVFSYFNDTGFLITSLTFHATMFPGLDVDDVLAAVVCNATPENPNPFFLHCSVAYEPSTGELTIPFFGVNPPDLDGVDGEAGDQEGIGSPPPQCSIRGFTDPRCGLGHFAITLNDGFRVEGDPDGGWDDPLLFPEGGPNFRVQVGFTPEPGTFVLVGGLLLLAGSAKFLRRGQIR